MCEPSFLNLDYSRFENVINNLKEENRRLSDKNQSKERRTLVRKTYILIIELLIPKYDANYRVFLLQNIHTGIWSIRDDLKNQSLIESLDIKHTGKAAYICNLKLAL